MQEKLWKPFGARNPALWSLDKKNGDEKAFCCINSNARDYARLGKLYLNNGLWNGVPIIDSSYSKEAVRAAELKNIDGEKNTNYGYQFWIAERKNLKVFTADSGSALDEIVDANDIDLIVLDSSLNKNSWFGLLSIEIIPFEPKTSIL